jgi:hypothetical protein
MMRNYTYHRILFISIAFLSITCREIPTFEANPVDPLSPEFQVAPPININVLVIDARRFGGSLDYRLVWSVPIVKPYGVFNGVEVERFNFDLNKFQEFEIFSKQTYFLQILNIENEREQFRVRTFFAGDDFETIYSEWVVSDVITKVDTKIDLLNVEFLNSSDVKLFLQVSSVIGNDSSSTVDIEKKINNGSYTSVTQVKVGTEFFWDDINLSLGDSIRFRARISNDLNNSEFVYSDSRVLEFDLCAPQYANVYGGMDSIYVYFDETISSDGYRVILRDNNESVIENRTVSFDRNTPFYTAFGDLEGFTEPFNLELFLRLDGQESEPVEYIDDVYLDQ